MARLIRKSNDFWLTSGGLAVHHPPVLIEVLEKFVRLCGCSTEGRSAEPSQTN